MISDDDLLADIRRVAFEIGHTPSQSDYNEYGEHSVLTVTNRYPWVAALWRAGLDPDGQIREPPISLYDVLEDVREVVNECDEDSLSVRQYIAVGEYSRKVIHRIFNYRSDGDALVAVAVGDEVSDDAPVMYRFYSHLHRLADQLDRSPTYAEFSGEVSADDIPDDLSPATWPKYLITLGLDPTTQKVSASDARDDLVAVADELEGDTQPTPKQYATHGRYGPLLIQQTLGPWDEALKSTDLIDRPDPAQLRPEDLAVDLERVEDDEETRQQARVLAHDIIRVAEHIHRTPSSDKYESYGTHPLSEVEETFGSFESAISAAAPTRLPAVCDASDETLIEDLNRTAEALGHAPTYEHYHLYGQYAPQAIVARFGGWKQALAKVQSAVPA